MGYETNIINTENYPSGIDIGSNYTQQPSDVREINREETLTSNVGRNSLSSESVSISSPSNNTWRRAVPLNAPVKILIDSNAIPTPSESRVPAQQKNASYQQFEEHAKTYLKQKEAYFQLRSAYNQDSQNLVNELALRLVEHRGQQSQNALAVAIRNSGDSAETVMNQLVQDGILTQDEVDNLPSAEDLDNLAQSQEADQSEESDFDEPEFILEQHAENRPLPRPPGFSDPILQEHARTHPLPRPPGASGPTLQEYAQTHTLPRPPNLDNISLNRENDDAQTRSVSEEGHITQRSGEEILRQIKPSSKFDKLTERFSSTGYENIKKELQTLQEKNLGELSEKEEESVLKLAEKIGKFTEKHGISAEELKLALEADGIDTDGNINELLNTDNLELAIVTKNNLAIFRAANKVIKSEPGPDKEEALKELAHAMNKKGVSTDELGPLLEKMGASEEDIANHFGEDTLENIEKKQEANNTERAEKKQKKQEKAIKYMLLGAAVAAVVALAVFGAVMVAAGIGLCIANPLAMPLGIAMVGVGIATILGAGAIGGLAFMGTQESKAEEAQQRSAATQDPTTTPANDKIEEEEKLVLPEEEFNGDELDEDEIRAVQEMLDSCIENLQELNDEKANLSADDSAQRDAIDQDIQGLLQDIAICEGELKYGRRHEIYNQ